ncbi:MAG: sugar transferase, partial [Mediterranea sp.]|nr:sugar transferase [Mediterranea sp.]
MYKNGLKRCIDFLLALMALTILLFPLLIVTVLLYVTNKGYGAFFLQERPGKDGR